MAHVTKWTTLLFGLLAGALLLAACRPRPLAATQPALETQAAVASQSANPTFSGQSASPGGTAATATASPRLPSPTPEPLALRVNGLGLPLAQYQGELQRRQAAAGRELSAAEQKEVLDGLLDQALLAQAAYAQGFSLDDAALQARLEHLIEQAGGPAAFQEWLKANAYDEPGFRRDLVLSAAAAWMRDQLAAQVPKAQEQVHVRQIRVSSAARAQAVLAQLQQGQDFGKLAALYDPVTYGDLGWLPRGYLTDPRLEQAVFDLPAGQHTPVIEVATGYHILQVIERAGQRPLDPQALLALQLKAVQDWLAAQRAQAEIQILVP